MGATDERTEGGGSSVERALSVLWSGQVRPARGPARGLTTQRIVAAAIEVAETEGLGALSMRRVATELGVGTASLYTYVPGKAELEALMLDAIAVRDVLPHEQPGDWRAKLAAWARDDWGELQEHPWVLLLSSSTYAPGPNMLRWLDSALRVLDGTGLTEPEKMAVIESVDGYVRGLARLHLDTEGPETSDVYASPGTDDLQHRNDALGELVDFSQYPAFQRALAAGAAPYSSQQFEFGLQRLLDGVEALIDSRTQGE